MTENTDKKISKNPEVIEKASRRRFTAKYKRRIAIEAEACTQPGEMGALLRREGLYSSVVQPWRRQLREESLSSSKKSSSVPSPAQPATGKEIASLKRGAFEVSAFSRVQTRGFGTSVNERSTARLGRALCHGWLRLAAHPEKGRNCGLAEISGR